MLYAELASAFKFTLKPVLWEEDIWQTTVFWVNADEKVFEEPFLVSIFTKLSDV